MFCYGNSAAIIGYSNGIVGMENYFNIIGTTSQGFVNRIIYDFIYEVMQAMNIRSTNIHTQSVSNMLDTAESFHIACFLLPLNRCLTRHKTLLKRPYINPKQRVKYTSGKTFLQKQMFDLRGHFPCRKVENGE